MAVLPVTTITRAGVDVTAAATAGGDQFPNTGKEFAEVVNGSVSSINVTIPATVDGQTVTALLTIAVPATSRRKIGPFPPSIYNNTSAQVTLNYSAVTTVTVGVYSY